MLVVDELLAAGLRDQSEQEEGVRRVARLEDIEPLASCDPSDEQRCAQPAVRELQEVPEGTVDRRQRAVLPQNDAVDDLV